MEESERQRFFKELDEIQEVEFHPYIKTSIIVSWLTAIVIFKDFPFFHRLSRNDQVGNLNG